MGSLVEFNDTLQITTEQGFPLELDLAKHTEKPFTAQDFAGRIFEFKDKPKPRIYHPSPTRIFLVQNINDKWIYWGHCVILEQTIHSETGTTSGKFKILKIYSPEHQRLMTQNESPDGLSYFAG